MRKLIRAVVLGAVAAWGYKLLDRKRQEWATRPAAEIRRTVTHNLPESVPPATRERIADKVVSVVKGDTPVVVEPSEPTAQAMTTPPISDPPASGDGEQSSPS